MGFVLRKDVLRFDMDDADSIDKTEEGITTYNYVQDIVSRYVDALKKFNRVEVAHTISNSQNFPADNWATRMTGHFNRF